jgi:hypothetical protein
MSNALANQSFIAAASAVLFSRLAISWPSSLNSRYRTSRPARRNASTICSDSLTATLVSLAPCTTSNGAANASTRRSGDSCSSSSRSLTGWPYFGYAASAIQGSVLR